MKTSEYLKSKALYICICLFSTLILVGVLSAHKLPFYSIFYVCTAILVAFFIPLTVEFFRKRAFYNELKCLFDNLDRKYLLSEMIKSPSFFEGRVLYEIIKQSDKSMNDEIAKYKISSQDYKEYIEKWVHEIKTPIAACKLAVENNKSEVSDEFSDDLDKIDKYVMQTLFYSRVSNVEKDYIIRKKCLNDLVSESLKLNSSQLIKSGFSINRENLDYIVMTDEKWIGFILDQIISNSIKYKSDYSTLAFKGIECDNCIKLEIIDNGIGIDKADLPRIFDKNFTGGNGRLNNKSTGFGLYLCKKLCDKLGIDIFAESKNGTTITLSFPMSNTFYNN